MRIGIFTDAYDPDLNGVATSAKVLYDSSQNLAIRLMLSAPTRIK